MSAEALVKRLERLMESFPKSGLKATRVTGLVLRLAGLASRLEAIASRAECLATVKGLQAKSGAGILYNTGCAGIYALAGEGSVRVWKIGSHAFSASIEDGAVSVDDENVGITVTPGRLVLRLRAGDTRKPEEVELTDVETIYTRYYLISYALKRLEAHLRAVETDLAKCSREAGARC
ncbi:hypothetical protein [Stetteria hydrogenophila]